MSTPDMFSSERVLEGWFERLEDLAGSERRGRPGGGESRCGLDGHRRGARAVSRSRVSLVPCHNESLDQAESFVRRLIGPPAPP